ncbi:MAG: GHMP kinase [Bryobacteraceae bacterium]|jgi:D-glycero-alpha-D-manno-heptose-7-phosphate kinase
MIITKTPFRISFAGGGSDLAGYYTREPGAVLSTAIDKYIYIAVKDHFEQTFRVSYSQTEIVDRADQIQHRIVRESLGMLGVTRGLEIVSMGDLPSRTGLGSSSSFTVGLLHALHAQQGRVASPERLANEACAIEIDRLHEPIGKQDQYIAAYGGLQFIQFNPDGTVFVDPVVCPLETRRELNRRLIAFFTGYTRDARDVLTKQRDSIDEKLPVLRRMCAIARELREVLTTGRDLNVFGALLHEAWLAKRSLTDAISNGHIDAYYERGLRAGALGGKLLGAGGGGFLLFFCEPHNQNKLRSELSELRELKFSLDPEGSKVVYVGVEQVY